jgi:drug/metabolite transporter (DMT)-like permease
MSPRRRRLLPWLSLLVIYVVWGSTYMAIRVVVQEVPPFAAAALRFFSAGLVMAGLAAIFDRGKGRPERRQILDYALVGVLLLGFANGLVMWSEQRIPSGIAALVVGAVPLWLVLLDGLRPGGQPWTVRVWLGTLVGLTGVALVARPEGGLGRGHWIGILALQFACLSWAVGSLYAQSIARRLPLFTASAVELIAGSAALLAESRLSGEDLARFQAASSHVWLGLLYLAVFGSIVGFTAFAFCLNELPASTVGTYAYVNPVVAVALGALFLGEPLTGGLLLGACLIIVAVVLTTRRPVQPRAPRGGAGRKAPSTLQPPPQQMQDAASRQTDAV